MPSRILISLFALFFLLAAHHDSPDISVASFSEADPSVPLMDGWEPLRLGKQAATQYALVVDEGTTVVQAQSTNAASGLAKAVEISPKTYPVLTWRWKVPAVLKDGDLTSKRGDDFAARIYVTFAFDPKNLGFRDRLKRKALGALGYRNVPLRALNYVWANKMPEGTVLPNAYTDWVQMIAVQSGNAATNEWHTEQRNVYDDYLAAFGEEPGMITSIAIMTDTDNTGGTAMAYYGDISLQRALPTE